MKNLIYILFLVSTTFSNAQTKESDFYSFFKRGDKYLKPVKYVLFDSTASSESKKKVKHEIYFYTLLSDKHFWTINFSIYLEA